MGIDTGLDASDAQRPSTQACGDFATPNTTNFTEP
jgi:hypothetical protein